MPSLGKWEHLAHAARAIAQLRDGTLPPSETLEELRYGWANDWAAHLAYLEHLAARAVTVPGPILECGSGVTTILLSALAGRRGIEVWVLEHDAAWHTRIADALMTLDLPPVNLRRCPLKDYGKFCWYDPPLSELPGRFGLVICDGPPGTTKGGRYGLWPILGKRLAPGAVVMLDDTNRKGEGAVLERWRQLSGGTATIHGGFATLTLPE